MTFKELPIGARFQFRGEYGEGYAWHWHIKTGDRSFESRQWPDGSGREPGRVGIGDNPVRVVR